MRSCRTSRGRQRYTLGVLCVVALLVARFEAICHLMTRPHARCEHGQLVHVDHQRGSRSPTHIEVASVNGGDSILSHQHEHCQVWATSEAPPEVYCPSSALELLRWTSLELGSYCGVTKTQIRLLWLAPKNSPPIEQSTTRV